MNGPSSIYRLKPAFKLPEKIEVPSCVYHLKKIQGTDEMMKSDTPACGDGPVLANILEQVKKKLKEPLPEVSSLQTRWDTVLEQLSELKNQMATIKSILKSQSNTTAISSSTSTSFELLKVLNGSVINASVHHPPYSLLLLQRLCNSTVSIHFSCHTHSSVVALPEYIQNFNFIHQSSTANTLNIILVWKEGILDTEFVVNPLKQIPIQGEVNILRLFARLGLQCLKYDIDEASTIYNDAVLDSCHRLAHVRTAKEKQSLIRYLNAKLGKSSYYGGENVNISDIAVWSVLKQIEINVANDVSQNMAKWFQRMESNLLN